jgi:hypothetical protein
MTVMSFQIGWWFWFIFLWSLGIENNEINLVIEYSRKDAAIRFQFKPKLNVSEVIFGMVIYLISKPSLIYDIIKFYIL